MIIYLNRNYSKKIAGRNINRFPSLLLRVKCSAKFIYRMLYWCCIIQIICRYESTFLDLLVNFYAAAGSSRLIAESATRSRATLESPPEVWCDKLVALDTTPLKQRPPC